MSALAIVLALFSVEELTPFPGRPVERAPVVSDSLPRRFDAPVPPEPVPAESFPAVPSLPPSWPPREPDRWLAMDKLWHFSASFATVGAGYHLCADRLALPEPVSVPTALGGTLTLGLTKELADLAGPDRHFSWKDVSWDLAGIGAGYLAFIHDW